MWDTHHCLSAAKRVVEMALHMNGVIAGLRGKGALIIHAPSDCMAFYAETPQRRRAQGAPHADAATVTSDELVGGEPFRFSGNEH